MTDLVPECGAAVDVSVVVVSYNTRDHLEACLCSLADHDTRASVEIIVVDNDSEDGSGAMVEDRFPEARLVRTGDNLGFGRGVNAGAAITRGRHLLLVNSDARILPGTIDAFLELSARRPEVGIIGGRIVDQRGTVDPKSCWGEPSLWSMFCFATGLSTIWPGNRVLDPESLGSWARDDERSVDAVSGALMFIAGAAWERLGGFDPDFFMYGEDVDLSVRARRAGFDVCISPHASATHALSASSSGPDKLVLLLTGKVTYIRKHWSGTRRRIAKEMLLAGVAVRAAAQRVAERAGRRAGHGPWAEAWRRRDEWRTGYSEGGAEPPAGP